VSEREKERGLERGRQPQNKDRQTDTKKQTDRYKQRKKQTDTHLNRPLASSTSGTHLTAQGHRSHR